MERSKKPGKENGATRLSDQPFQLILRREFRYAEIDMIRHINKAIWGSSLDSRYTEEKLFATDWHNLGDRIFPRVGRMERRVKVWKWRVKRVWRRIYYRWGI